MVWAYWGVQILGLGLVDAKAFRWETAVNATSGSVKGGF